MHHLHTLFTEGLFHIDCVKELTCQPEQGVLRPVLEPVDCAAVDQGGEHTHPGTEVVADRAECQHNVQVFLAFLYEETVQLRRSPLFQFTL